MSLTAYLGIASGLALVLTGVGLGLSRPRRAAGWFFAAFVLVWGAETALFNAIPLTGDIATVVLIERAAFAFILVEVLFLTHFAVRFTGGEGTRVEWLSWGAAGLGLAAGLALAADPSLFSEAAGTTTLATVLVSVPKFAAFFVTLGVVADRHRQDLHQNEHRELRIVLVGLALYAAYTAGFYLSLYTPALVRDGAGAPTTLKILAPLFALATAYLLVLVVQYARLEETPPAWSPRERGLVAGSLVTLLVLGVGTGFPASMGLTRIDLFGLLRIGSALIITYGLLKFEIFDIDRKVKAGLKSSLVAGTFVVVFFSISETVEFFVSATIGTGAGLAAAGLLTLAFRPIEETASGLVDRAMPGVDDSEAYEERRTREIYQAAVERAAGDEVLTEREEKVLAGLREDLDLGREEALSIEERFLPEPVSGDPSRAGV